ncbi:MAG: hypothetical protein EWV92_20920 [Microcystis aeruginosa Ma_MB_S_20031200_S102]|uniref:Uncharacterized protein n=1 Tax=Microcystis aeruginosa Ma_MB_S_20031200_S102 TaxID=2486254 RepID=A0A552E9I0_MICAE|nr:MAG: hypothetical protein EWV79_22700 [Microcystis aeruginosa Ma_MB_S_20031200_S102D]TRU31160.1 MAG: hypothetical protein EWV92_20920 [Microcystis aeruginosa Ma_MB_S_20031200_S102]
MNYEVGSGVWGVGCGVWGVGCGEKINEFWPVAAFCLLPFAFCLLTFAFPNQEVNFARLLT